ncbi:MAG: prolipoprotein diacylglyceryl transferase [Anaerolineales bacterium]|nr:prolipoprotein diacylglyceryl transferase [Anaerolineales bacterium]
MYPTLPFGPITLPTGAILTVLAVYFWIDTAARYGKRLKLRSDDVWNTGLLALAAGIIVARLWNVIEYWYVYADEPGLIISLRPSGFSLGPGIVAALVAAYAYLLFRALSPTKMAAAFALGAFPAAALVSVGDYLTGIIQGLPSDLPWAMPYYGEALHPAALYRAVLMVVGWIVVWAFSDPERPGRTLLQAGLAYGLIDLFAGAFMANDALVGPFRQGQAFGFTLAVICAAGLAYTARKPQMDATQAPHHPDGMVL